MEIATMSTAGARHSWAIHRLPWGGLCGPLVRPVLGCAVETRMRAQCLEESTSQEYKWCNTRLASRRGGSDVTDQVSRRPRGGGTVLLLKGCREGEPGERVSCEQKCRTLAGEASGGQALTSEHITAHHREAAALYQVANRHVPAHRPVDARVAGLHAFQGVDGHLGAPLDHSYSIIGGTNL